MRRYLGIRWITIALIMLGAMVNFLSRATLSVAAPTVMESLHITTQQYSYITGAFQAGILLQSVVGYMIDVMGVKVGFAIFAFAWSVICAAHGFATSWQILAALRGVLGFAEGAFSPGGLKVVAEWFPAKERGLAGGLYNIGPSIGQMLAPPLVVWAILYFGNWQASFVIVGAISLSWVVLWLLFYYPVAKHPKLSAEERELIVSGQEKFLQSPDDKKPSMISLLKRRNFWGVALPRFLTDPTWGMLSFWVPLYLTQVRGFDLKHIAMYAWLPFLAADLGCIFGPSVVLFLQKRGWDLIDARRGAFTLGAFMMIGVAFTGTVQSVYVAVALLCLAGFAHQTLSVTMITMATDLFPRHEVGTVAGMAGTSANLGVLISSLLIGGLVTTIGYSPFFIGLAVLDLIAAVVVWTVIRKPIANA